MTPVEQFNKLNGEKLINAFNKRNFEAYYCNNKAEATNKILSLVQDNSSVSFGGSMTLSELGVIDMLHKNTTLSLLDRNKVEPELLDDLYHKALSCDYFLMSSNAITIDGKLINIDGRGNRVAALVYGPKNVIVVVGINKLTFDEEDGIKRARFEAAPKNKLRFDKNTPCSITGTCSDCTSEGCICSNINITRFSMIKNRIKVIVVGESLGF